MSSLYQIQDITKRSHSYHRPADVRILSPCLDYSPGINKQEAIAFSGTSLNVPTKNLVLRAESSTDWMLFSPK